MTLDPDSVIWATRGKTWGFRFLRNGGTVDPLPTYESAFAGVGDRVPVYQRVGRNVVLRFLDPEGRSDASGRVIPHDFVVLPPVADEVDSLEAGMSVVWTAVAAEFAAVWELPNPAAPAGP